ncbi:MAG: acyl-CoA dehydrogenase family protein [Pseudomonadales bacterium]
MVDLIKQAENLAPLLRETAREAETNRQPLDHVIEAIRESGLFSLMVPKKYGGHEADLDTFFDVVLTLSRADASMGWITGFYIEHNLWLCNYAEDVCAKVFDGNNHVLAPAALNIGAGQATKVEGGYVLGGQWQWGTGIVHGTWVLAGGLVMDEATGPVPTFFLMPKSDVEPIDTWHVTGMCATGSWDFKIDDVFVPDDYALPFQDFLDATSGIAERFSGPLYSTPLMPVLGFAAGLPILGAAQTVLAEFSSQMRQKIEKNVLRAGTPLPDVSGVIGEAALKIDTAELVLRDVMADVMAKRNKATNAERAYWLSRMSYAVYTCKAAVLQISEETGASGGFLSNPIQRAVRDISIAANHVVFSKSSRYGDVGRAILGQDTVNGRV